MVNTHPFVDPELQFLIDASAPTPRKVVTTALDWPRVVRLARTHRVYPRVWARHAADFPAEFTVVMRTLAAENSLRSLRNVARTIEVVRLLRDAGINSIVLKGPLLAHDLYGDVALRVAGDVDVLVREEDFQRGAETLAASGYRPEIPVTEKTLKRLRRRQHDLGFTHPEDDTLIELHADIAQPHYGYGIDLDLWWRGRRERTLAGDRVWTPSPVHAYLLTALHAAKHRWHRLDLVVDVAAHLEHGIDRVAAKREAANAWLLRPVETGEEIAAWLFAEKRPLSRPARAAISQLLANKDFGRLAGAAFDIGLRERAVDKARYLARRALSAKSRM